MLPVEKAGYIAHSWGSAYAKRFAETQKIISERADYAISISWGKDSCALLACAASILDEVLVLNAAYPNPNERFDDIDRVRDGVLARLPNVRYLEVHPPGEWEMYERAGGFFSAPEDKIQREAARWWKESFEREMSRGIEELGATGHMLGLRADESKRRLWNYKARGDDYIRNDGTKMCLPISLWSARDVWATLVAYEMPYLHMYDVHKNREKARSGFVFATSTDDDVVRRLGGWQWMKWAYPEEFRAWIERFPEMAVYA